MGMKKKNDGLTSLEKEQILCSLETDVVILMEGFFSS